MKITRKQLRRLILEDLRKYLRTGIKGAPSSEDPAEKIARKFFNERERNAEEDDEFLYIIKRFNEGDVEREELEELNAANYGHMSLDIRREFSDVVIQKINELEIDPENMSDEEEAELASFLSDALNELSSDYKQKLDKNIKSNKVSKIKKGMPDVDVPYVITNFAVMAGNYDMDEKINTIFHSESGEELDFATSDLPIVFKDIEIYDFKSNPPPDKSPFIAGYVDSSKPQKFYLPRML